MKIDFNGQEMTIKFDKVPKFLYFNEESKGVGKVFLNGIQRKGLIDVKVQSHTRDSKENPDLQYHIQYVDEKLNYEPQFLGNMRESMTVTVKITDTEIFKNITKWIKSIIDDERIPENIRNEYNESLKNLITDSRKENKNV